MLERGWRCENATNRGLDRDFEQLRSGVVPSHTAIDAGDCLALRDMGASAFPELVRSVSGAITAHDRYITALHALFVHLEEPDRDVYFRSITTADQALGAELSSMRLALRRAHAIHVQHLIASIEHQPNTRRNDRCSTRSQRAIAT